MVLEAVILYMEHKIKEYEKLTGEKPDCKGG